jgi:hypothetical protein
MVFALLNSSIIRRLFKEKSTSSILVSLLVLTIIIPRLVLFANPSFAVSEVLAIDNS